MPNANIDINKQINLKFPEEPMKNYNFREKK